MGWYQYLWVMSLELPEVVKLSLCWDPKLKQILEQYVSKNAVIFGKSVVFLPVIREVKYFFPSTAPLCSVQSISALKPGGGDAPGDPKNLRGRL